MKSLEQGRKQRRRHMIWYWMGLLVAVMVGVSACGEPPTIDPPPGTDVNPPPARGQTDFTTTEQGSNYNGTTDSRESGAGGMSPNAPSAQNDSANKGADPAPPPAAPSGRTGTVEEADLYRVSGSLLFYLNTYKGLTIFDLKDAKNPKKLGNLPVFGYPIEMFVEGNIAYALVKDALYLLKVNGKFQFHRRHVSQLVTIDITDRSSPKVLQRLDIQGQLREGVSRKIDKTIYVVSYKPRYYWWGWSYEPHEQSPEQATVYSYNITNPKAIVEVGQLDLIKHPETTSNPNLPGGAPSTTNENRSFSGVTISATSNTLLVGEQWYYSKYENTGGCGRYESYQEMVMSVIDISDVTGKIKVHTRFKVRGTMTDQFKQTYIYDKATNKGTYFGIFLRQEWKSDGCSRGERLTRNTMVSIDITDGSNPRVLDELIFGKPNETVRGSVFDRDRGVAYAITAVQTDPLYAISIKDPKDLKILSAIDGLSGDISVFRFVEKNQFLLAVGRDNSSACTGFGSDQFGTNMAVSIIDVRDLSKIRLVQRKCVAIEGAKWSHSAINWNLDQAHKMLGMYSSGNTNLVTLPVSYYVHSNRGRWWWGEYKSAIGIMQWDLSKYDDTKDETQQTVLENIATMEHPKGAVKRTIIVNLPQDGKDKRVVINLSDTHISLVDLDDLRKPSLLSTFEIAPYVRSVYRFGKYILEQVTLGTGNNLDYNEFRVKAIANGDINDATIVSRFVVGQIQKVVRWNNLVLFFRYHLDAAKSASEKRAVYDHQKSDLLVYDLSDPQNPKERGALTLPFPFIPHYYFFCGTGHFYDFGYYYYSRSSYIETSRGLASLYRHYDYKNGNTTTTKLFFLDVSNPDKPALQEKTIDTFSNDGKTQATRYYFDLAKLDGDRFYLTSREYVRNYQVSTGEQYSVSRYHVQPWSLDNGNWKEGDQINVPGRLVKAYRSGTKVKFLTQDYGYVRRAVPQSNGTTSYRYQNINRLYLLEEDGKVARLKDFHVFKSWYLRNMQVDGDRLYMAAQRDWYYLAQSPNDTAERGDQLLIFDLKNDSFKELLARSTRTHNMQIMGVKGDKLFLNLPGEGLLVADVKDATQPKGLHFERTLGWLSHIEFDGDYAFAASGHFGIYQIDLTQSTIPAL